MKKLIYYEGEETNYLVSSDGKVFNKKNLRQLKGTRLRNGYYSVQLVINKKPKTFMVHRLVAEAFCDNPNHYNIVDHIDRNKQNNDSSNLRWVTSKENSLNCEKKNPISKKKYLEDFDNSWIEIYDNYMVNKDGIIVNKKTRNIVIGAERNGYYRVSFNGSSKKLSKHRVIWEAFNGKIPEGFVVDHIDGNRQNNKLENLRLVNQSDNMLNAQKNGHKGQIKISQYDSNGKFIAKYDSIRQASIAINGSEIAIKDASLRHGKSAGFFWIREDDDITIEELLKITPSGKPKSFYLGVTQYSLLGEKIKYYNSLKEAARENGCSDSTIKRAAEGKRAGKGYYWIMDNQNLGIEELLSPENSLIAG